MNTPTQLLSPTPRPPGPPAPHRTGLRSVGIIGGMGPAAAVDFARRFVHACERKMASQGGAVFDQGFPEHWIAQVPLPDRTQALARGDDSPLQYMSRTLQSFATLGIGAAAIACNTAHAWHTRLQASQPAVELLHVADEVARHARALGHDDVCLLATDGTYRLGFYGIALQQRQVRCHHPPDAVRQLLTRGIYEGVKAGNMTLAESCFAEAVQRTRQALGNVPLVMGCTEIPLALRSGEGATLIDSNQVLADALAERAFAA